MADPMSAAQPTEAKRVVTASEPVNPREAAVTATIYIGDIAAESTAEIIEQTSAVEPEESILPNDEMAMSDVKTVEAADEEVAVAFSQEAENLARPFEAETERVQLKNQNGHGAEILDEPELIETVAEAMPAEQFVDLNGESMALTSLLESLLFVSDTALEPAQVAKVLPYAVEQIEAGLQRLRMIYQQEGRGLRVQERNGRYLLVTMPAAAPVIEAFLNLDLETRLSGPALEALAVIAYRQPVTRAQIEAVRGVDCGHVLRVLLQHELIEEAGRLETVGRPILYTVTDRFLQHFGLTSMSELPKLESSEADMLWAATQLAEEGGESQNKETSA
ncbi:MAG: SMC-Scp complex subunit ScpB [Caldilineaceae bacterium]